VVLLSDEQQKILKQFLIECFIESGRPFEALRRCVGDRRILEAPPGATVGGLVEFALTCCRRDVEVLRATLRVIDPGEILVELTEIRAAAESPPAVAEAPPAFQAIQVGGGEPFLDRKQVRHALKRLLRRDAAPILVINGADGMGKSYTARLIEDEAARTGRFRVAAFEAKPDTASFFEAASIAMKLVEKSGGPRTMAPLYLIEGERRVSLLVEWVADELRQAEQDVWLVLDGFDQENVREETTLFIDQLLALTASDTRFQRLRIVMLDFSHARLRAQAGKFHREVLVDPAEAELAEFFKERFPQLEAAFCRAAAAKALQAVPPGSQAYMFRLKQNVERIAYELGARF